MDPMLVGTAIKSGVGLATGMLQSLQAKKLKDKANSNLPQLVDPRQASFLSELNQKRRSMDTGADFAAGMSAIDTGNAGTNQAITQNTGGDVGGTIQALLQSERVSADAKNNVLAQGQQQQMQLNGMFNDLNNKIAARQMQLQMYKSQQAQAEWAKKKQTANQNMGAAVAGITGLIPGAGKGADMGQSTATPPINGAPSETPAMGDVGKMIPDAEGQAGGGGLDTSFLDGISKVAVA